MLMSFVMFVSAATMGYTILSSMWLKSLGSCAMLERKAESRLRPYSLIGFKCAGECCKKSNAAQIKILEWLKLGCASMMRCKHGEPLSQAAGSEETRGELEAGVLQS